MRILISNDDGYFAPGIEALANVAREFGEVTVVAPERDRSGASNSLTLDRPLSVRVAASGFMYLNGTPTDCVHLAITGLLEHEPDMVVAGVNTGANLGDDVLYSGTVAAATEGRFLGLPTMAVSCTSHNPRHLDTAARVARELVERLRARPLSADTIINVNVPDLAYDELRGFRATRLGHRHKAEAVVRMIDPRGHAVYWVGPAGPEQDAGPGTDFDAVRNGFVSVTPLQVDLTRHSALPTVADWLGAG